MPLSPVATGLGCQVAHLRTRSRTVRGGGRGPNATRTQHVVHRVCLETGAAYLAVAVKTALGFEPARRVAAFNVVDGAIGPSIRCDQTALPVLNELPRSRALGGAVPLSRTVSFLGDALLVPLFPTSAEATARRRRGGAGPSPSYAGRWFLSKSSGDS